MQHFLAGLAVIIFAAAPAQHSFGAEGSSAKTVPLVQLEPTASEYGMLDDSPPAWNLPKGKGVLAQAPYPNTVHWKNGTKIVREIPDDFSLPGGERYRSRMTEIFAVEGDVLTGVGLWCPSVCSYHWVEFEIPKGTRRFSGELYITDDVHGSCFHQNIEMNNWVSFVISIDGKKVWTTDVQRFSQVDGSGEKVKDIQVTIPKGAKKIRFFMKSHPIDNNHNTELVISNGTFTLQ